MSTRNISINLFVILAVLLTMDLYVYWALQKSISKTKWKRWINAIFLISVVSAYVGFYFLYTNFTLKPLHPELISNFFIGFFFSFFVFKLMLILFFLIEDVVRLLTFTFFYLKGFIAPDSVKPKAPGRRKFIRQSGLFLAAIPFGSMLFGITKGKYNFKINKVKLALKNLPEAFDGFKLVHVSDIHSGSFDDKDAVIKGIQMINDQGADAILFTGDLVNNDSNEILPFIEDFKKLSLTH